MHSTEGGTQYRWYVEMDWVGLVFFHRLQAKEGYLQGQIGNPDGDDKPNKKFYDPRVWIRKASGCANQRVVSVLSYVRAGDVTNTSTTTDMNCMRNENRKPCGQAGCNRRALQLKLFR